MDFSARIALPDGREKLVILEIQKAKFATDIMQSCKVKRRVPPEACDKKGRTTVAAFRPWRGLPALNPHPLTAHVL